MAINQNMEIVLMEAVRSHIKKTLEEEFDRRIKEAFEGLNRRKDEIVAGTLLDITKMVSMERIGPDIRVTIKEIPQN